jgi:hypothetical protein
MSYVIQNFHDSNKKINLTPRFKFIFILNNLEKFLIFIKINTFLFFSKKINIFNLNYLFLFFKYFFSKKYIKLFYQLNLVLVGNYSNNLTKSSIFNVFFFLLNFFKNKTIRYQLISHFQTYFYNLYFFSIKTLNIRINNTFYKNIFFLLMLINPFI